MNKTIIPLTVLRAFVARRATQKQAAQDLGVSGPYLSDILLGKRGFSPRMLLALGLRLVQQSNRYEIIGAVTTDQRDRRRTSLYSVARRQAKRRTP